MKDKSFKGKMKKNIKTIKVLTKINLRKIEITVTD